MTLTPVTVGDLTIPRYGFITVEEDDRISDELEREPSALEQAARIADAIALAEGITILEAYRIVGDAIDGKPLSDEAEAIMLRHSGQIKEATRIFSRAGTARMRASVAAILAERCGLPGVPARWPRRHFQAVWQLFQDEQAAENLPTEPLTGEQLGKQQPAPSPVPGSDGASDSGS